MKHTPGPWKALPTYHGGDGKKQTGFWISANTKTVIANAQPAASMSLKEMRANARLIASAPMLLWAAMQIIDEFDYWGEVLQIGPDDAPGTYGPSSAIEKLRAAIRAGAGKGAV